MYQLLESIKIKDNIIYNIEYHNKRLNNSRQILYNSKNLIDLNNLININNKYIGLIKCRVICDENIREITYEPYKMRRISSLKIIYDNEIDYTHKILDKEKFKKLLEKKENCDEIIIIKNNLITDTSFSNVILFDGNKYYTPANPLLKGTKREKLINEGLIFEDDINIKYLKNFKFIQFINAMVDIEDNLKLQIENIY